MAKEEMTYKGAGVDVKKANAMIPMIIALAKRTHIPGAGEIGGFGGAFILNAMEKFKSMKSPVLVSSTDGVGTKLKVAFATGKHNTVGIDLAAMCVNDIAVQGAQPLFFLDYFATGVLKPTVSLEVIEGIAEGCRIAGCALLGGETAEMPGLYQPDEYDLAGFTVGVVDQEKIIDGSQILVGDQIIGIPSSGLHSNGYSLVRRVAEKLSLEYSSYIPELNKTWGEELLTPTKIYVKTIMELVSRFDILGMAHITGGSFDDNIPRILPEGLMAVIQRFSWPIHDIFDFIQENGPVEEGEMYRTFNNGIGLVLVVKAEDAGEIIAFINSLGEQAYCIGEVKKLGRGKKRFQLVS